MSSTRSRCPPAPATKASWAGAGLLLVGHGSSDLAAATEILAAHAAVIRARGLFGGVAAGFLRGSPSTEEARADLPQDEIYVVPFFLGEGYFTEVAVPRRLGLTSTLTCQEGRRLRYCPPIGCSTRIAEALAEQGRRTCAARARACGDSPSRRRPRQRAFRRLLAPAPALDAAEVFRKVRTTFIEEAPLLADRLANLAGEDTVVIGALAGLGHHALDDIPEALEAERARRAGAGGALAYAGVLGAEAVMPELILGSVRAFDAGAAGRIASSVRQPQPAM